MNLKKTILISLLSFSFLSFAPALLSDCNTAALRLVLKSNLGKFKYDSSKITRYIARGSKQVFKNSILLFPEESYKLMFNSSSSHQDITINVYDKSSDSGDRKLLYSSKKDPKENGIYTYIPNRKEINDKIYVEYEVTGSSNSLECTVFLLGFI